MSKIAYITLGCPKNQVDTEELANTLGTEGFLSTDRVEEADALIINTCCFIDDAKKESIEAILQIAQDKRKDSKLIVMGCMGEKYSREIREGIPEIEAVYGVADHERIRDYLLRELSSCESERCSQSGRDMTTGEQGGLTKETASSAELPYAYVKIADGCNRRCSFCVIPSIRGKLKSMEPGLILKKVSDNLKRGKTEIILIAQDITEYGKDLGTGYTLASLVRDICSLQHSFRLRLLYLHPKGISDDLLTVIADEEKVCKYIDMPIQHSEDRILSAMRRGHDKNYISRKIDEIRSRIPSVTLRTTLMVGFPGETEEDFCNLLEFVRNARFDHLGVFRFSPQMSTDASSLKKKVSKKIAEHRYDVIMRAQSEVSFEKNRELVGATCTVLIDEIDMEGAVGRTCGQAPEIDGVVLIEELHGHGIGDIVDVRILRVYDYDVTGEIINTVKVDPAGPCVGRK